MIIVVVSMIIVVVSMFSMIIVVVSINMVESQPYGNGEGY
jgi:hypothetical protein